MVKRLKEFELPTPDGVATMMIAGERDMGKGYGIYFAPDTERIHCSELVQRIHQAGAGVTIGEVQRFGDMDFSGADARRMLKDRLGKRSPVDQPVVTPTSLFRSLKLIAVDSVGSAPSILR